MTSPRNNKAVLNQNPSVDGAENKKIPTESEINLEIKLALHSYCKELAADLDQKKGVGKKYFEVKLINKVADDFIEEKDSKIRQDFLSTDFEKFYNELTIQLKVLTELDIKSIGRKETDALKSFRKCFEKLNEAKFYNANGRPIVFWSGEIAQEKVKQLDRLSDSDIPSCSIMSKLGILLKAKSKLCELSDEQKAKYRDLSDMTFKIGSSLFAKQSSGDIYLYFSAANKQEDNIKIYIMNNNHAFWEASPARDNLLDGEKYFYVRYNHTEGRWEPPADLTNIRENPVDTAKRRNSEDKNEEGTRRTTNSKIYFEFLDKLRAKSRSPRSRDSESSVSKSRDSECSVSSPTGSPVLSRSNRRLDSTDLSQWSLGGNEPGSPSASPVIPPFSPLHRRPGTRNRSLKISELFLPPPAVEIPTEDKPNEIVCVPEKLSNVEPETAPKTP